MATVEIAVDRAIYAFEVASRTYRYVRRNPEWRRLTPRENERNKRRLDGCTRIFPDGRRTVFAYRPPYTTRAAPDAATGRAGIDRLTATVEALCRLARETPPALTYAEGWGDRETLAHLVFWHEQYVRTIASLLAGREPDLRKGTFSALNTRAVERLGGLPPERLAERLETAHRRLVRQLRVPSAGGLEVQFKAGGKARPLPEFIVRVDGHLRGHLGQLRGRRGAAPGHRPGRGHRAPSQSQTRCAVVGGSNASRPSIGVRL